MDKMIELYKSHLKLNGCMLSLIDHEDAIVAIVYRVIKPDGKQYILKISERSRDDFREEEISDETAFHLVNFFIKLTGALKSRYYTQMKHYVNDYMPYRSFCFTEED